MWDKSTAAQQLKKPFTRLSFHVNSWCDWQTKERQFTLEKGKISSDDKYFFSDLKILQTFSSLQSFYPFLRKKKFLFNSSRAKGLERDEGLKKKDLRTLRCLVYKEYHKILAELPTGTRFNRQETRDSFNLTEIYTWENTQHQLEEEGYETAL